MFAAGSDSTGVNCHGVLTLLRRLLHLWYFWYFWPFAQVTREKRDPRLQLASGGAAQLAEQVAEARCAHYLDLGVEAHRKICYLHRFILCVAYSFDFVTTSWHLKAMS